jgi:hypothetical protein
MSSVNGSLHDKESSADDAKLKHNNAIKNTNKRANTTSCFFSFIHANANNTKIQNQQKAAKNQARNRFSMSCVRQLEQAISKGDRGLCEYILNTNAVDLNKQIDRKLFLGIACEYNNYDIVELLLKVTLV